MIRPVKCQTALTYFMIMSILFSGIATVLAFTLPRIMVDQPVTPVTAITGSIITQWQIREITISVQDSAGRYLQDLSSNTWEPRLARFHPQMKGGSVYWKANTYHWRLPLGFTLPKDDYQVTVTSYRQPNLVFKKVIPVTVFYARPDASQLFTHIRYLAAPERQGRAPGSPGGRAAACYIAGQFQAYGLRPGGNKGWYQDVSCYAIGHTYEAHRWRPVLELGHPLKAANVLGVLPGKTSKVIIVSAHYDHLGTEGGMVFNGANDNATGVSAILEVARIMAANSSPGCTIIFAAWTGEEEGMLGSNRFAGNCPDDVVAVVNLDCIGNGAGKLVASGDLGAFKKVLGISADRTGLKLSDPASYPTMVSDHLSFSKRGIPAISIYSPHWMINNHTYADNLSNIKLGDLEQATNFTINLLDLLQEGTALRGR